MARRIAVGTAVTVRLHDGGEVEAKVTKIVDSDAGRKVQIAFGPQAFRVDETQIIEEMRGGH